LWLSERFRETLKNIMLGFKKTYRLVPIFFFTLLIGGMFCPVRADIYLYVDEQGIFHFTNTPTSSDYKLYLKESSMTLPSRPSTVRSEERSGRYDGLIQKAADHYKIPFPLLKALIKVESDFDPLAVSRKGAKGLMQIMPDNFMTLQIKNAFDPSENIMGGTKYLKQLLEKFDKNVPLALAAYNAGPNMVERYGRIPPITETIDYVDSVMTYYHLLKLDGR